MTHINPSNLRALRMKKGLSLEELSTRSNVDRGTISRIERGKQPANRRSTIERLTSALQTDVETLTGSNVASSERVSATKSQVSLQMENLARNALTLVAARYGIKPSHILHVAPLLFLWAAEESLKQRQTSLDALAAQMDTIEQPNSLSHLHANVFSNWRAEEIMDAESVSISKHDLFGLEIYGDAQRGNYEDHLHNPMSRFMARLCGSLGDLVDFNFWFPDDAPNYYLGRDEASKLVGGDHDATCEIICGNAPLHELSKNIRDAGPEKVAIWAKERGDKTWAEMHGSLDLGGEHGN